MNNLELLAEKLNEVSDTYEAFVSRIVCDCKYYKVKNPNVAEQILEYIEKYPDADSSDILDFEMTAIGIPYCDDNGVWRRCDTVISESEAKRIVQEAMLIKHCRILRKCIKSYSEDTTMKVVDLIDSEEIIEKLDNILKTNPTETKFLEAIKEL